MLSEQNIYKEKGWYRVRILNNFISCSKFNQIYQEKRNENSIQFKISRFEDEQKVRRINSI